MCDEEVDQCSIYTYGSLLSERFRYRGLLQVLIKRIEMFFLAALVIPRITSYLLCDIKPYVTVTALFKWRRV